MTWRRFAGIVAAAVSAACSLDTTEESSVNVYVSVDRAVLHDGQVMTATITARNVGYEAFTLTGPSDCLLFLEVLDTQGNVVWHSNGTCAGQTVTEALAPGEDKVRSIMWNGSNLAGARLPPGFYHVRGVARVTGGAYNSPLLSVALE